MIRGKVERFDEKLVGGWLTLAAVPDAKAALEVLVDGRVVGRCIANQPRSDVAAAGHGDGLCGFLFRFPQQLEMTARARARLRLAGTEIYLERPQPDCAPGPQAQDPAWPVFILGSPRSGTSALVLALLRGGYHGFPEGNLLGLMHPLDHAAQHYFKAFADAHPDTMMGCIDTAAFRADLLGVFRRVMQAMNPHAPWLDKSGNPGAILGAPELLQLWPSARVVFARRRGIENVVSRLRKFPAFSFEEHCSSWANNMSAWRTVRPHLPDEAFIEIDQRDMVLAPAATAAKLARTLRLTSDTAARVTAVLRQHRPQQTEDGSAERLLSLEQTGWSEDGQATFRRVCGPEMDHYGYSMDTGYQATTANAA